MSENENLFIKMMDETRELSQHLQTQIKKLFNIIEMQNKFFNILISHGDKLGNEDGNEPLSQSLPIKKNQAKRKYHFIPYRLQGCPGSLSKSFPGRLLITRRKPFNRKIRYRLQTRL